jgi:hypothetical protein
MSAQSEIMSAQSKKIAHFVRAITKDLHPIYEFRVIVLEVLPIQFELLSTASESRAIHATRCANGEKALNYQKPLRAKTQTRIVRTTQIKHTSINIHITNRFSRKSLLQLLR